MTTEASPDNLLPESHTRPRARKFEVTKEELHELVWSMPTTEVAKLFKVSDNAIGKRCRLLGIEKPPRGYWQKKNKKKARKG